MTRTAAFLWHMGLALITVALVAVSLIGVIDDDSPRIATSKNVVWLEQIAAPESDALDADVVILQQAIFAVFGLSESRYALIASDKVSRRLQVWG